MIDAALLSTRWRRTDDERKERGTPGARTDFFYVWMRRSLRPVFPELFATLAVQKVEEPVVTPYRHVSREKAEIFILDGMAPPMHRLAEQSHPAFPVTIYYAFKQDRER